MPLEIPVSAFVRRKLQDAIFGSGFVTKKILVSIGEGDFAVILIIFLVLSDLSWAFTML